MTAKINWISVTKGIDPFFLGMYEVSDTGLIRRVSDGGICANIVCSYNYTYTIFIRYGVQKRYQTQRIVALHYVENPHNHTDIIKIDKDRENNAAYNLKWVSRGEAIIFYRKEKHVIVQQTMSGEYIAEYDSLKIAAKMSGAHSQAISNCISGRKNFKSAGGFTWKKIIYTND